MRPNLLHGVSTAVFSLPPSLPRSLSLALALALSLSLVLSLSLTLSLFLVKFLFLCLSLCRARPECAFLERISEHARARRPKHTSARGTRPPIFLFSVSLSLSLFLFKFLFLCFSLCSPPSLPPSLACDNYCILSSTTCPVSYHPASSKCCVGDPDAHPTSLFLPILSYGGTECLVIPTHSPKVNSTGVCLKHFGSCRKLWTSGRNNHCNLPLR